MKKKNIKLSNNKIYKTITKNMTLGEVLKLSPKTEQVFAGFGMHCFACPISQMETLEEASFVHQVDLDLLLQKLNDAIKN